MESLTLEEFRETRHDYDRLVDRTPDIDEFCSSSYWILPALDALFPTHDPWVRRGDACDGYVALAKGNHPRIGSYLQPMEASWGLSGPLVGDDLQTLIDEFAGHLERRADQWDMLFLSGVFEDSLQFQHLIRTFQPSYTVGVGPSMARHVASLKGGFEGYMERRSSKFRSNMRRARRKAEEADIDDVYLAPGLDEIEDIFERILAVEHESWKAENNSGIATGPMRKFYGEMVPMLARDGKFRVSFIRKDDQDIAYCFGGLFDSLYRGLQLSYHDDYREYSAGNLAQLAMLEGLCREGIETYDMGQAMDYKSRWADRERESIALIIRQ